MIKNKRGSHVSFIISFVLFVGFLIFFIGIIKPLEKIETGKSSLLKHLENEIINEVSEDVLVVSAKEEQGGEILCADLKNFNPSISRADNSGLIKIYSSSEFLPFGFDCDQKEYEIGLVRSQKYVLESKVLDLNESYDNNYETLKTKFGIPEANDFEFSFLDIDETPIIESKFSGEIPSTEVLAELVPINYLTKDAEIKNGYIKVILW